MKVTNLIFVVYYIATATVYRGIDAMGSNYMYVRFLLDLAHTMLHDVIIASKINKHIQVYNMSTLDNSPPPLLNLKLLRQQGQFFLREIQKKSQ